MHTYTKIQMNAQTYIWMLKYMHIHTYKYEYTHLHIHIHINAQIYSVVGRRISVWNQPREIRTMYSPGEAWTPEEIASMLPNTIKQEPNPFIDDLERRMKEMEAGDNSGE